MYMNQNYTYCGFISSFTFLSQAYIIVDELMNKHSKCTKNSISIRVHSTVLL